MLTYVFKYRTDVGGDQQDTSGLFRARHHVGSGTTRTAEEENGQSLGSGGGYGRFKRDLWSSRPSAQSRLRMALRRIGRRAADYTRPFPRIRHNCVWPEKQLSVRPAHARVRPELRVTTYKHTHWSGRRYLQITILLLLLIRRLQNDTPTCADVNVSRRASNGERQYHRIIIYRIILCVCVRAFQRSVAWKTTIFRVWERFIIITIIIISIHSTRCLKHRKKHGDDSDGFRTYFSPRPQSIKRHIHLFTYHLFYKYCRMLSTVEIGQLRPQRKSRLSSRLYHVKILSIHPSPILLPYKHIHTYKVQNIDKHTSKSQI